jgi:hypothetical protein
MHFHLRAVSGKTVAIASLALAFLLIAGTAFASLTFNSTAITSDGALTLNPTGQPVTVNGNFTVTGSCTGCGGGTPGGSNTQIQFNNSGAFGGSAEFTWDGSHRILTLAPSGGSSLIFGSNLANLSVAPQAGSFLVGTSVFADDPSNGDARIQFAQTETNPNQFSLLENQMIYNPTANSTGGTHGYGFATYFQGSHNINTNGFGTYHPGNITAYVAGQSSGSMDYLINEYLASFTFGNGPINTSADLWIEDPTSACCSMSNVTNRYAEYIGSQAGSATNPYDLWIDEAGVFRIKSDNTFNSVYQAIPALYNPQFTKYTPGATNYERLILGQWESNVATITPQAGGTGTLRALQLGDASVVVKTGKAGTVSSLPTCNAAAQNGRGFVTDATQTMTAGIGAVVVGSGSNAVPVYCDGTNWRIGG